MKTNRILFLFAAVAMLCSCAKELATDETYSQNGEGQLTLNVNLDQVKTALGVKDGTTYPQTWSAGDFLVLNGVASSPLAEGGSKGASFVFQGTFQPPYNVVYCGKADAADVVVFPAKQTYVAGTFAPFTAPLYGSGSNVNEITMQPINSALRIPLTGEATISKIVVEALGGEKISGEFTLGKASNVYDGTFTPAETAGSLATLDCGDGVTLSQEETPFFVTLPAGTYTEGLRIYAVSSDKKAMVLKLGSLTTIAAGKVYELPVKDFAAGDTYVIAEPADMDVLPTLIDGNGVGKTVILIDDIDMTGKAWTSFGSGGTANGNGNFTATIDGQGHTISGLTTPLFGNLAGIAKNLTVEANYTVTSTGNTETFKGSSYGAGVLASYLVGTNDHTAGKALIDNVRTKGSVTINCDFNHDLNVGGLVGCSNGGVIQNCTNEATVTFNGKKVTSGNLKMGGVCGCSQGSKKKDNVTTINPKFTDNINKGAFVCKAQITATSKYIYAGGVIGHIAANNLSEVKGLKNYADVEYVCSAIAESYFAGVVGNNASGAKMTDFLNEGNMTVSASVPDSGNHIAGVVAYCGAKNTNKNIINRGDIHITGFSFKYCTVAGAISRIKGSPFAGENIINEGNITFDVPVVTTGGSWARIGGITAQVEGMADYSLSSSRNSGNIILNNANGSGRMLMGGVIGHLKATKGVISKTVNSGDITINGVANGYSAAIAQNVFGGIIGETENNAATSTFTVTGETGVVTNSGKIALYDDGNLSYMPHAGGIIGYAMGTTSMRTTVTVSNCTNAGVLDRKVSNYTYVKEEYTSDNFKHYAGGIMGRTANCKTTITSCINTAQIVFDKNKGTNRAMGTDSQVMGFCAGILGQGGGTAAEGITKVTNCHNSGNVPVIEGYCGGIVGYCWDIEIAGEKGNYCTNTGDIAYRANDLSVYPQVSAGGIIGGGSTNVAVKWCYNTGNTCGNGGISGLVGRTNNINSAMTIQNCKTYGINYCGSSWSKAGFLIGFTCQQEDPAELLKNVSHIAVGGKYVYKTVSSVSDFLTPTADNYNLHLYYNKTTAPADAQDVAKGGGRVAATAAITVDQAINTYDITLWDGTSALPWEN